MPNTMVIETEEQKDEVARMATTGNATDSRTAATVAPTAPEVHGVAYSRSCAIAALAAALAKAQGKIAGASKDKTNPHFKSSYADLASVWEACRDALSENGLAVLQPVFADGARVTVTTILTHSSGEWISTDLTMTSAQSTPQAIGSCITYARRYALASLVGVAPEDDDGEGAQGRTNGNGHHAAQPTVPQPNANGQQDKKPEKYDEFVIDLEACADEGMSKLMASFNAARAELRNYLTRKDNTRWELIKSKAATKARTQQRAS